MSLFVHLQKSLPQRLLSSIVGVAGRSRNASIKRLLVRNWINSFDVNMSEAARTNIDDYDSFVDFFTRELRPDARPIDPALKSIVSPVDGTVSQVGMVDHGTLVQAKGHKYSLDQLVGENSTEFNGGQFVTIYLAPRDYHRVHAPTAAQVVRSTQVPGNLFSVNAKTEAAIQNLFCENERLVIWLETDRGNILVVMVAALIVAGIETTFGAPLSPYRKLTRTTYPDIDVAKGEELGRFTLGSTVILVLPSSLGQLEEMRPGQTLRLGEAIGSMH